jgi:hypothetical protein
VRKLENSGDSEVSPAGAIGRYQIMPGTALQYGGDPSRLKNPIYNEQMAAKILADLVRRYKGDTDEILTAYNAGPGVANKYRRSGHDPNVLPLETRKYIEHAHRIQGVNVTINNQTGNNVAAIVCMATLSSDRSRSARSLRFGNHGHHENLVAVGITLVAAIPVMKAICLCARRSPARSYAEPS